MLPIYMVWFGTKKITTPSPLSESVAIVIIPKIAILESVDKFFWEYQNFNSGQKIFNISIGLVGALIVL